MPFSHFKKRNMFEVSAISVVKKATDRTNAFSFLQIRMKKLLDFDWLRAVQFKCNTSAKTVALVEITHHNS